MNGGADFVQFMVVVFFLCFFGSIALRIIFSLKYQQERQERKANKKNVQPTIEELTRAARKAQADADYAQAVLDEALQQKK